MNIGEKIYLLRKKKNLTQEQLGEILNISPAAISKWETGNAYPDIILLPELANVFNVSIDYLFDYDVKAKLNITEAIDLATKMIDEQKYVESIALLKETLIRFPNDVLLIFELAKNQFILARYFKSIERINLLKEAEEGFLSVTRRECSNHLKIWSYHYLTSISIINNEIEQAEIYNNEILLPKNINPIISQIAIKTKRADKDTADFIFDSIKKNLKAYCLKMNWLTNNLLRQEQLIFIEEEVNKLIDILKIYTDNKISEFDIKVSELYETLAYLKALKQNYRESVEYLNQSIDYILRYEPHESHIDYKRRLLNFINSDERTVYRNIDKEQLVAILDKLS